MAGTRRSTRQTTAQAPRYNDADSPSAEDEPPKRNGTNKARQKRPRDEEHEHDSSPPPPPPKKAAKSKHPAPSSSPTNRTPSGDQEVFWLLKAEPLPRIENGVDVAFSIDDLAACTVPEPWSGVRNPQARNNMQAMRKGDLGFFYHSNAKPSGVVGVLRVVEEAKVDETAFDSKDPYYDAKSDREKPKWYCVGVEFVRKFDHVVDLARIKSHAGKGGELEGMQLVTNSRLSVNRVTREEWDFILSLAGGSEEAEETEAS